MPKKKCEKGKVKEHNQSKDFYCGKCGATSNNKEKLCKPKRVDD
ncbi:MAG: hypothetical protein AB7S48_16540 [Bacteroidales bacterium]